MSDAVVLRTDIEQADTASLADAYAKMQGLSASDNRKQMVESFSASP